MGLCFINFCVYSIVVCRRRLHSFQALKPTYILNNWCWFCSRIYVIIDFDAKNILHFRFISHTASWQPVIARQKSDASLLLRLTALITYSLTELPFKQTIFAWIVTLVNSSYIFVAENRVVVSITVLCILHLCACLPIYIPIYLYSYYWHVSCMQFGSASVYSTPRILTKVTKREIMCCHFSCGRYGSWA